MAGTIQADFLQPQSSAGLSILNPSGNTVMASVNSAGIFSSTGSLLVANTGNVFTTGNIVASNVSTSIISNANGGTNLTLNTNNTTSLASTLYMNGNISFANGAGGIIFNNASATTNSTLNDYEVGTYTPTDQSGAGLTFTFARTSIYTKIGNLVNVQIDMTFPSTANSSTASISLPFTNINFYGGGILIENGGYGSVLSSEVAAGGSTFSILNTASNSGLTNANLSGKRLIFLINYRATF